MVPDPSDEPLVARELQRYSIDIAAFIETRFADIGDITEPEAGYTLWSR